MLLLCFTHFQVLPEFVDFLFPFGFRSYAEDFYFSGFRQRTQLAEYGRHAAPNARPADKKFQICYNLKSVEPSDTDSWSIRHCAIQHSFDMKVVRTSWIILKGDELMKRRIESATSDRGPHQPSEFNSLSGAFKASLQTHLILCDWSAENWRWYINSLEDKFEGMTRRTFSAPVHVPLLPAAATDQFEFKPRTNTQRTDTSKISMFSRTLTQMAEKASPKTAIKHQTSAQTYTNPETGVSQPLPPNEDDDGEGDDEPQSSPRPNEVKVEDETRDFSFSKLRKVYQIAKKANEAVLVLRQNILILTQLRQYYRSISRRKDFPRDLAKSCEDAIDEFELRVDGVEHDTQTQILRLETLLRLLEDRKTLVRQIYTVHRVSQAKKRSAPQHSRLPEHSSESVFDEKHVHNDRGHE